MDNIKWWSKAASHMWRVFFQLERDGFHWDELSDATKRIYSACQKIYASRFTPSDQKVIKYYYNSRWGDDVYAVEDYSLRNNIPVNMIWMIVRRANRMIIEEFGLIDRREG